MKKSNPRQRSIQWFARQDIYGFIYRSWMKNRGVPQDMFDGRPVIGICNTWSDLLPGTTHFAALAAKLSPGLSHPGGFLLEFRLISPGAPLSARTASRYRILPALTVRG